MLLGRETLTLRCQLGQSAADAETCVARLNDIIDISELGCLVRISEGVRIFLFFLRKE